MRPILFLIALLATSGVALAQEGYDQLEVGTEVEVQRTDGVRNTGIIKQKDSNWLTLQIGKFGSIKIAREDIESIARSGEEAGDEAGDESAAPVPVEVVWLEIGGAEGKSWRVPAGSKVDLQLGGKTQKGYQVVEVVDGELVSNRYGMEDRQPLEEIEGLEIVELPEGVELGGSGDAATALAPTIEAEWPPEVGAMIRLLLAGDTEVIRGTVLSANEESLELEAAGIGGTFTFERGDIEMWAVTGTAIRYQDLAQLIRVYAADVIPEWAGKFLKPNLEAARAEAELLGTLDIRPAAVLAPARLSIEPLATGAPPKLERDALREYYDFQRARYLACSSHLMEYFLQRELFEEPKTVRKLFTALQKEKLGKPAEEEVDTAQIGTRLRNRLGELASEIDGLSDRTHGEEKKRRKAELETHVEAQTRLIDALQKFERFRKLWQLEDEQLDEAILEHWEKTHGQINQTIAGNSTLASQVDRFELVRPWTLVLDLSIEGALDLETKLGKLYAEATSVPFGGEDWLFNRDLRGLTASIVPSSRTFSLRSPTGGADTGHSGVYHLVVYRHGGEEICRMVLFRIEPGLHVRAVLARSRLLFCDAEEWMFRW